MKEIIKFVLFIFIFFISNIEIFAEPVVVSGIQYITTNEILKIFQKQLPADNRTIIYSKVPRGLVLSIDKSIFFEQDSVVLKDESNVILDKIGKILKETGKPCVIEGNTRLNKTSNTFHSSWEISTVQAQELAKYLIKNFNIPPVQIRSIGFGEIMPFEDNVSFEGKLEERIDFVILNYDKPIR